MALTKPGSERERGQPKEKMSERWSTGFVVRKDGHHATARHQQDRPYFHNNSAATLEEVLDHYNAFFANLAQLIPPPNLPALLSSNGLVVDRGFVTADERAALLAYLRKL